jgi:hypothetical protein
LLLDYGLSGSYRRLQRYRLTQFPAKLIFQTNSNARITAGKTGTLTGNLMWQQDAYRMIQRRTRGTGIKTRIGNQDPSGQPASPHT